MTADNNTGAVQPLAVSVPVAAAMIGVSRDFVFGLIRDGEIESMLLGPRTRRIPVAAIHDYMQRKSTKGAA